MGYLLGGYFNEKWQLVGTTVLGASVLLGACGGGDSSGSGSGDGKDLKGEAKGEGSSTVAPIVEKLNEKWAKDHPNATISSGQAGTGAGFEKFIVAKLISHKLLDLLKMKKTKIRRQRH